MRTWAVAGAISAFLFGCAALPDQRPVDGPLIAAAEIRTLEGRFATAFNNGDARTMEDVLAAEYSLLSSGRAPGANLTRRDDWMRVWRGPQQVRYEAKVLDVVVAGNTAVAVLEARWTRNSYLTDTWVQRNGRWQLIFRHSVPRS